VAVPAKVINTNNAIVNRLRALVQESPDLINAAQVYEVILPLLRDADLRVAPLTLTPGEAQAKMELGLPLLHDLDLELDVEAMHELMIKLARAVEIMKKKNQPYKLKLPWLQTSDETITTVSRVRLALEEDRLDISALLLYIAAGNKHQVISAAQDLHLDPDLVWTLAQNALKPALREWCRQLTPIAKGIPWHKGTCYACGASAILGELQENDQVKHLRCGSCGADWKYRRLQCMHCGNEDHRKQRYLFEEVQGDRMRVEVCDNCGGYLKVISAFTPTPPEMLPIEDLATLQLDYIAALSGYSRSPLG
jgi:FdhE protein